MPRRIALYGLVISTVSVVLAYALAFTRGGGGNTAPLLMVFGIAAMAVSLMTLGAVRAGEKMGILGIALAFVFAVLMGGFALALLLPHSDGARTTLFLGLPPRAAIVIYGIGLLPVLVLPFVYALTFEQRTLTEADLKRVKEAAAAQASNEAERTD
jgi:hypothetical protein